MMKADSMETLAWAEHFVSSGSDVDVEISYYERPLYRINTSEPRKHCRHYLATLRTVDLWIASKAQITRRTADSGVEVIAWVGKPISYWQGMRGDMLLAIEGLRAAWTSS